MPLQTVAISDVIQKSQKLLSLLWSAEVLNILDVEVMRKIS